MKENIATMVLERSGSISHDLILKPKALTFFLKLFINICSVFVVMQMQSILWTKTACAAAWCKTFVC